MTKKYKISKDICWLTSLLLNIGPALVYMCIGFSMAEDAARVSLTLLSITALILCGVNIVFKNHLRSPLWLMVLGIYFCMHEIQTLLVIMAVCTVVDEFIVTPLYKRYKNKFTINREIDKRIEV